MNFYFITFVFACGFAGVAEDPSVDMVQADILKLGELKDELENVLKFLNDNFLDQYRMYFTNNKKYKY